MEVEEVIKKRQSIRNYSHETPDWRKIVMAIDAARYAPSAGNMQRLKFILVKDVDKLKIISEACQQDFVGTVKYIVVAVANDKDLIDCYAEKGIVYAREQAGAAIQNFLLELTNLGLATCWIGYFVEDQIKRALTIPEGCLVEGVFPIGLETKVPTKRKDNPDLEKCIYFDKYGNRFMEPKTCVTREAY